VLFRSAAVGYTFHAILSGTLDDGMWAIQRSGGHGTRPQSGRIEYPKMPLAITKNMEVDYANERGGIGVSY